MLSIACYPSYERIAALDRRFDGLSAIGVVRRRGFGAAFALVLRGHRPISTASSIYSVALQTVSRRWRGGARPNLKAA